MITCYRSAGRSGYREAGFTLVELMTVVLVIGILITIAVPVYARSRLVAESKACQANQRTILSAIAIARTADADTSSATAGEFAAGGSGWYDLMIPEWIRSTPKCSVDDDTYHLSADGEIIGDSGAVPAFKEDHQLQ